MTDPEPGRLRLSHLPDDTAAALALVEHFDRLSETGASPDALVRAAALVAECPVSASWSGRRLRYDAAGDPLPSPDGEPAARIIDGEPVVRVERAGQEHALDGVLAQRLRHTLTLTAGSVGPSPRFGDPALLEVSLSSRHGIEDRTRALRLLGFDSARPLRVLAVAGPLGLPPDPRALDVVRGALPAGVVHTVRLGTVTAVVLQTADTALDAVALHRTIETTYPATALVPNAEGPWVGIGGRVAASDAPDSWRQARRALRFASSTAYGRRCIAYDRIGSLGLLADLPAERLRADPDVRALDALAGTASGRVDIVTFEAFCMYGSLRRTANELHVHHTTVAARLARVERAMGWRLDDPLDRFKAMLALMVRRIALTAAELDNGRCAPGP